MKMVKWILLVLALSFAVLASGMFILGCYPAPSEKDVTTVLEGSRTERKSVLSEEKQFAEGYATARTTFGTVNYGYGVVHEGPVKVVRGFDRGQLARSTFEVHTVLIGGGKTFFCLPPIGKVGHLDKIRLNGGKVVERCKGCATIDDLGLAPYEFDAAVPDWNHNLGDQAWWTHYLHSVSYGFNPHEGLDEANNGEFIVAQVWVDENNGGQYVLDPVGLADPMAPLVKHGDKQMQRLAAAAMGDLRARVAQLGEYDRFTPVAGEYYLKGRNEPSLWLSVPKRLRNIEYSRVIE